MAILSILFKKNEDERQLLILLKKQKRQQACQGHVCCRFCGEGRDATLLRHRETGGGRGEEARRERGNRRGKRGRNYWGQVAAATPAVMPFMAGWQ